MEFLFPFGVRHAVDAFSGSLFGHLDAFGRGRLTVPIAKTVAAEVSEDHQVDVLNIFAIIEVGEEAPERGGVKLILLGWGEVGHPTPPPRAHRLLGRALSARHRPLD